MQNVKQDIQTEQVIHKGEPRIKLIFSYDSNLITEVRKISGCRWSASMKCWHVPDTNDVYEKFKMLEVNFLTDKTQTAFTSEEKKLPFYVKILINPQEKKAYIGMQYNELYVGKVRAIQGSWWHPGAKVWSVDYNPVVYRLLRGIFSGADCILNISETNTSYFEKQTHKQAISFNYIPSEYIKQLKLENKSERTIEIYCSYINQFLDHFRELKDDSITDEMIREYILDHRINKGYSEAYQNQMVSSIRSFYRNQYNREFEDGVLPRPKKGRYLPKVIPREDIQRMICICRNEKHKMILLLLYGFGLRLNELVNLRLCHINLESRQLLVVRGKGKKDRVLPIPRIVAPDIKKYIKSYLPKEYFIMGQGCNRYSDTSVQNVIKNLAIQAGIKVKVTPHIIRHCYATHLLERGTDLRYIQKLLGHSSSKTTEIYTHVSMGKLIELSNPLDDLKF